MGLYETPAPGVRQKKPQIVPTISRGERYYLVRKFPTGIGQKGDVVFRGSKKDCEAFVANGCRMPEAKPRKKKAAKK